MKYRKIVNLDWEVSALGFGCMRFPSKGKFMFRRVDEEESIRILRKGIDMGINYPNPNDMWLLFNCLYSFF